MTPRRPTPPPLTKTERQALEDLIRRGARALNPAEGNRLLRLLELDQADRQQERRTAGAADARNQKLTAQLKAATTRAERAEAQLAALHEGEEPYEDERAVPTPGQFIWSWNHDTPAQRLERAAQALDYGARVRNAYQALIFMAGHPEWQQAVHDALTGAAE